MVEAESVAVKDNFEWNMYIYLYREEIEVML